MKIPNLAVNRPVFVLMTTMILMVLGGISLSRLPIDLMPEITYPTLSVVTQYKGAGPEEVEKLVSRKIEQALSAVPGAESISSNSSEGSSSVRISFSWGTNLDEAANDIRDRLDRIISSLPVGTNRPTLRKFDLAQFPVLILGGTSSLDPAETLLVIENQIRYRIEKIQGVAALDIWGGVNKEIEIILNADKLRSLGIDINTVINAIRKQNINIPVGSLREGSYEMIVRAAGEFNKIQDIKNTLITNINNSPIFLGEIATITLGNIKNTRIIKINGEQGVRIAVRKQAGANSVKVSKSVLSELEKIAKDVPQIKIVPLINTSKYIEKSIFNVTKSAIYGGIFAILILVLFLRNIYSIAIIAFAIPASIITTFIPLQLSNMTLNMMSLGGLAVGVGLIIDNAIVVLENIYRYVKNGMDIKDASVKGASEVSSAIIASTMTTLVIFLPLLYVRGMSGIMFSQLAFVIGFALLCSLFIALTIIPMMSSKLLKSVKINKNQKNWLTKIYGEILYIVLDNPMKSVFFIFIVFISSTFLYPIIGKEFMPSADQGEVRVSVEMDTGTNLEALNDKFNTVEEIVRNEVKEAENIITSLGGSSWRSRGSHQGRMTISLVSEDQRNRSSEEIARVLGRKLKGIPGVKIRSRPGRGLFIFRIGQGDGERVQIEIRGYDLNQAFKLSREIQNRIKSIPGIGYVRANRIEKNPEKLIKIDHNRAADLGVSISDVAETIQAYLSGVSGGVFRESGNEYNISLKVKDAQSLTLENLLSQKILNNANNLVSLKNMTKSDAIDSPMEISRLNQERVTNISVSITGRDMNLVISDIKDAIKDLQIPEGFSILYTGDYEAQEEAFNELMIALLLSIVLIYMVMCCLYESFRDPLIVLFSIPTAGIGVLVILILTDNSFNVQSWIGCIMLGGIVVNNAILLVDQIKRVKNDKNIGPKEAIVQASLNRIRPILMTALTTTLAMIPLAIGLGEGSEAQSSMAKVVIGGLTSSTLTTLFLIPSIYLLAEKFKSSFIKIKQNESLIIN